MRWNQEKAKKKCDFQPSERLNKFFKRLRGKNGLGLVWKVDTEVLRQTEVSLFPVIPVMLATAPLLLVTQWANGTSLAKKTKKKK